jgi:hypothetical protein
MRETGNCFARQRNRTTRKSQKATDLQAKSSKLTAVSKKSEPKADPASLQSRIAVSAYYKSQARGFEPGHQMDDWLAAEKEETL